MPLAVQICAICVICGQNLRWRGMIHKRQSHTDEFINLTVLVRMSFKITHKILRMCQVGMWHDGGKRIEFAPCKPSAMHEVIDCNTVVYPRVTYCMPSAVRWGILGK
jgi:hypothetical protein